MITLDRAEARRLAVRGQLLAEPRPASVMEVFERLGRIQVDPTDVVARTEHLVLWSRLGPLSVGDLERLLWEEHALFEYRAYMVRAPAPRAAPRCCRRSIR